MIVDLKETAEFYPIVGHEGYFLTDDFRIFSKKTNRFLLCRYNYRGKNSYYHFALGKSKKQAQISLPRIAYSVKNGINPISIPSDYIITFKENKPGFDNIVVSDRSEVGCKIYLIRSMNPANELFYERCHEFTGLILKNDTEAIFEFIDKYKNLIVGTLCKYMKYTQALKVYSDLKNDLVIGILDRRYQCYEPVSYLQKCIKRKFNSKN
ncbi:MAG: hypothetical protein FWD60_09075 [Candidatus Azobacteroides sp.]|nr:hypothetical protein [Candidatus Azobacteroides sp.]